jgi:hypothetical protein
MIESLVSRTATTRRSDTTLCGTSPAVVAYYPKQRRGDHSIFWSTRRRWSPRLPTKNMKRNPKVIQEDPIEDAAWWAEHIFWSRKTRSNMRRSIVLAAGPAPDDAVKNLQRPRSGHLSHCVSCGCQNGSELTSNQHTCGKHIIIRNKNMIAKIEKKEYFRLTWSLTHHTKERLLHAVIRPKTQMQYNK